MGFAVQCNRHKNSTAQEHRCTTGVFKKNKTLKCGFSVGFNIDWLILQRFILELISLCVSNLQCHRKGSEHNVLHPNSLWKISDTVNKCCCFGWLAKPFMGLVVAALYILFSCGICLPTALAAILVGIMETLSATETYRRGFAKPMSSLQRNLAKWVSAKSFNFITIYHCGIKHDQRWLDPEKKKHSMSAMSTFITPRYRLYKKLFPDFVSLWWHAEAQIAYTIQADTFSQKEKQYLNLR